MGDEVVLKPFVEVWVVVGAPFVRGVFREIHGEGHVGIFEVDEVGLGAGGGEGVHFWGGDEGDFGFAVDHPALEAAHAYRMALLLELRILNCLFGQVFEILGEVRDQPRQIL